MKKYILKIGILCLLCLMLGSCSTEKNQVVNEEEEQMFLYHKVDIAIDFGMFGGPYLKDIARDMLDKKETYDNVFFYAEEELADAAIERGEIGERDVYAYATETTIKRLEVLNLYIEMENLTDKLDAYELEYPITLDDLINKTESLWQILHNAISRSAYRTLTRWR